MSTLALDIATKTGYAHSDGTSGVWDFKAKKGELESERMRRIARILLQLHVSHPFDLVVCEKSHYRFRAAATALIQYHFIIKMWCEDNGIPFKDYFPPAMIKKHGTGKGNAKKPEMVAAAQRLRPNKEITSDDEADAIILLDLAGKIYETTSRSYA